MKKTFTEIVDTIHSQEKNYQFFEIWIDYMTALTDENIEELVAMLGDRLIILFRRRTLEKTHMPLEKRLHIMDMLSETNAFLDLDIMTQPEEVSYRDKHASTIKLIASYHNYTETPDEKMLASVLKKMDVIRPMVYKISTFCHSSQDSLRLLTLLLTLKDRQKEYIVLGMGEKGVITRIFGTLWGNKMIFAPLQKSDASAPGQLTKDQLEEIFGLLSD